jgi:hypothetical protein
MKNDRVNNSVFLTIIIVTLLGGIACSNQKSMVTSPDKKLSVHFQVSADNRALYTVTYDDKMILDNSRLGIIMEDEDFSGNLRLESESAVESVKDNYTMLHGKKQSFSYTGNKKVFHLVNGSGKKMDIIFQVSNDGMAFRYYFPDKSTDIKKIKEETSSFHFPEGTKAFLQPLSDAKTSWARTNPSYEEYYKQDIPAGTPSPNKAGWVFPALFKCNDAWVLITETALNRNYCGSRLKQDSPNNEYFIGFPQAPEVFNGGALNPESILPWYSPWRVIAVGSLKTIVESTLGTDLANPEVAIDKSFIKPGRASWSWVLLKDDSCIYDVQKRFIDFAADMSWEYCLIDAGWDTKIGYDRIKELADYANRKNVGIILWYNSAGDWNDTYQTPKSKLLTHDDRLKEFNRIKEMGIKGVKVDFFGGDGQSVINYYLDILDDAAKCGLVVNFHGCTLPRGWQRTYPHLLSMEAIRGMEYVTFEQPNADAEANHCAMIPFTRNAFDPMDFTPVAFSEVPNIKRTTTNCFELALSVLFLSGIQHFAEIPQGMAKVPDYVKEILKEVPVSWVETRFIDGFPGKLVVIARKSNKAWYIAGINGEEIEKKIKVDLSFLGENNTGIIISDGNDNRSFRLDSIDCTSKKYIDIDIQKNGGFLLKFDVKD